MPVYNAELFLDDSISSILNQTFSNFKFLIIDDGSTDNSNLIIQRYLYDSRIDLITLEKNVGLISALNVGLSNISGDYMIRMDADDISHPDRIRLLFDFMELNLDIGICGTQIGHFFDPLLNKIPLINDSQIKARHLLNCSIIHASAIYRLDIFRKISLKYKKEYPHSEDNALITDILLNSKGAILGQNLYWVRKHENQVSFLFRDIQKDSSCKRRVELLLGKFNCKLNSDEIRLYKALSYKEDDLQISDFRYFHYIIGKMIDLEDSFEGYNFDKTAYLKLLKKRVRTIYLLNYKLGFSLFFSYFRILSIYYFPGIGLRLFIKILFYKFRLIN